MCSNLDHVTELKSNITNKTISFQMTLDDKPVNTGSFRIKSLQGPGLVNVNLHEALNCLRSMPQFNIRVLVNGEPKLILQPIFLFRCVRITLEYCVGDGIETLSAKGLDGQKGDSLLRIRYRKKKRQQVYGKRENVPEFVSIIGKAVLEEDKTELKSDNKTCEAVAAVAGDCCIKFNELISELNNVLGYNEANISSTISPSSLSGSSLDLLEEIDDGQPSPGPANPLTTALNLTYKKPSVLEELGEVAVITSSGVNKNMVREMSNKLIGSLPGNEIPKGTSICECLRETLREFGPWKIELLSDGFFALLFSSDEYITKVLEHSQLFIIDKPLILKRWTQHLVFSQFLDTLPVWVRLYNLNWAYWSTENLSFISSKIGFPLFMDNCTANIIRDPQSIFKCASTRGRCLDVARVCIEIDPDKVLPSVVIFSVEDKLIPIRVEYEWRPQRCMHCASLYHDSNSCNRGREDALLQSQDNSVITEDLKTPEQVPGNMWTPPRSSDEDVPPLIPDDDEYDVTVVESGPQSTVLSSPETLTGNVETPTSSPVVGPTRLRQLLKLFSRVLPSRKQQHLSRSNSL